MKHALSTPKAVITVQEEAGKPTGTYHVYIDQRYQKRTDIHVVQSSILGIISFKLYATWEPGASLYADPNTLNYDDVGFEVYEQTDFGDAVEILIDNADKLSGATWIRLTFDAISPASDCDFRAISTQIPPKV